MDFFVLFVFYVKEYNVCFVGGVKKGEVVWCLMVIYLGYYYLIGYFYLVMEEKYSGKFVGMVGFWNFDFWFEFEFGYWLVLEG